MFKQMSDLKCGDLFRVYSTSNKQLCFVERYSKLLLFPADASFGASTIVAVYIGKMTIGQYQYMRVFTNSKVFLFQSFFATFNCEVVAYV